MHSGHPGVGFEVDLMAAIAGRVGFTVRYESALWRDLVQRLIDGGVDMICSAATITTERRQIVDFSAPYLSFPLSIVVRVGEHRGVRGAAGLAGRTIGVREATMAERFVRESVSGCLIRAYHFNTEAYGALAARDVDAVVDDHPIAGAFASLMPALQVAARIRGTRSQYGIMFRKGNAVQRKAVDAALRSLQRDGTHAAIERQWFPHAGAK
jgi:ABC-type amino acid transport substrate-binding protein